MTSTHEEQAPARRRTLVGRVYQHSATRFLAFSGVGLSFDLTVLWMLRAWTPMPLLAAVTVAFVLTYVLNFFLNRHFAFHAGQGEVTGQLGRFLPQVTADYLLVLFGVAVLVALGLPELVARTLSSATNAVLNYTAYRWWTFRGATATRARATSTSPGAAATQVGR